MRKIKFRAWDLMEHKMIKANTLTFGEDGGTIKIRGYRLMFPLDVELMQYTGLKDKNGVEIYEGDVLRWGESFILQVIYDKNRFSMQGKDVGFDAFPYFEESEVIGNIYDNGDLLC